MISANKEGFISLPGYFAFQLIGIGIGRTIYTTLMTVPPDSYNQIMKTKRGGVMKHLAEWNLLIKLFLYAFLFWVANELSLVAFDIPSRRLCNMSWFCF